MLAKLHNFRNIQPKLIKLLTPAIVLLVGVGAFGLGRLSVAPAPEFKGDALTQGSQGVALAAPAKAAPAPSFAKATEGLRTFVASKNGTKYYLTSCSGASRISEQNRVYFVSAAEAQAAGFSPAANCSGL